MFQNIHIIDIFILQAYLYASSYSHSPTLKSLCLHLFLTLNRCAQNVHVNFKEHSIKAA